jgi:2,4-dichlorophenol 6-monooxygenase
MNSIETDVLVVGAGLTGATAGILLARQGIDALVVSRARWVADSPRAHIMNQRTMEVFRTLGLEKAATAVAVPGDQMANHFMATAVSGPEFGRMWTWGNDPARQGEYGLASPTRGCDLPQDRLEPVLISEAAKRGANVRFSTKFLSLEQDAEGVTSTLEDLITGHTFQVRSKYVIGADGGQSPVAEAIGLPMSGTPAIAPAMNIVFRADLTKYFAHRPGSIFWIAQPWVEGPFSAGMLRMVEPWNRWVAAVFHLGEKVAEYDPAQIEQIVRDLIQDDDVEIELDGVYPWRINHVWAERYFEGRVFCAGDAVHRHPPMNGLGGNTCVQDAFNLVWKLAAVLRGGSDPRLLETYDAERRPIGKAVVDAAIAGFHTTPDMVKAVVVDPAEPAAERQRQFEKLWEDSDEGEARRAHYAATKRARDVVYHAHGTEMNQAYTSAAVLDDGSPAVEYARDPRLHYVPSSRPGSRLPHAWVEHKGRTVSTLDLTSPEHFTVLARDRGAGWLEAARVVGEELGIEIRAFRIGLGREVTDLYTDWAERCGIGEQGCLLVRPDQFVAWRQAEPAADPTAELRAALSTVLARG